MGWDSESKNYHEQEKLIGNSQPRNIVINAKIKM